MTAQEAEIQAEITGHQEALERAVVGRGEAETAHAEEERRVAGLVRAAADRREGLARLTGQVNTLKSRAAAAEDEIGRLSGAREEAEARAERAQREFTSLETRIAGLDAGERGLDAEHEGAAALLEDIDARLTKLREEAQAAERERAALVARKEALELGLSRKDGAGALLAASEDVSGLLGSVAALLSVRAGYETAVAASLGSAADAVAVSDVGAALGAINHLKDADLGRAGLVLGGGDADGADRGDWPGLPAGTTYALDVVEAPASLGPALRRLLFKTAVVDDLDAARRLVADLPDVVAVTREGDLVGAHFAAGGSTLTAEPDRGAGGRRRGDRGAVGGDWCHRAAAVRGHHARERAAGGAAPGRRGARQAARVRRCDGRGRRGARSAGFAGPVLACRGGAGRRGDHRGRGRP